jgi:hypothetical protein
VGRVRTGHCIWLVRDADQLPIQASVHNRLLPRLDQTPATLARVYGQQVDYMRAFRTRNVVDTYRNDHCAKCGASVFESDEIPIRACNLCIRVYHKQPCMGGVVQCCCGGRLQPLTAHQRMIIEPPGPVVKAAASSSSSSRSRSRGPTTVVELEAAASQAMVTARNCSRVLSKRRRTLDLLVASGEATRAQRTELQRVEARIQELNVHRSQILHLLYPAGEGIETLYDESGEPLQ